MGEAPEAEPAELQLAEPLGVAALAAAFFLFRRVMLMRVCVCSCGRMRLRLVGLGEWLRLSLSVRLLSG